MRIDQSKSYRTLLVFRIAAQWVRREMFRMEEDNGDRRYAPEPPAQAGFAMRLEQQQMPLGRQPQPGPFARKFSRQ
jgi:hypothetical protein